MSDDVVERLREYYHSNNMLIFGAGIEAAAEIERLRAELAEAKRQRDDFAVALDEIGVKRGAHIITDGQINAAWEYATHPSVDPDAIRALNRMGIVACLGCGGSCVQNDVYDLGEVIHEQSCAICNGNGWVMEVSDD